MEAVPPGHARVLDRRVGIARCDIVRPAAYEGRDEGARRHRVPAVVLVAGVAGARRRPPLRPRRTRSRDRRRGRSRPCPTAPSSRSASRPTRRPPRRAARQRRRHEEGDRRAEGRRGSRQRTSRTEVVSPRRATRRTATRWSANGEQLGLGDLRNLDKVGAVIDAAVAAGANQVNGPNLVRSDATSTYRLALRAAIANAREGPDDRAGGPPHWAGSSIVTEAARRPAPAARRIGRAAEPDSPSSPERRSSRRR